MRSILARGSRSLKAHHNEGKVWNIIERQAKKQNIRIYSYANAGNHLHILLKAKSREDYVKFIRSISGLVARHVMGAERGLGKRQLLLKTNGDKVEKQKFWDARPFTRIVNFGKNDFARVKKYLLRNTLETIGWIPKLKRSKKLTSEWKSFWHVTCEVPL